MKKCPFCAEEIQDEAIVCKHCGRDLTAKPQPVQQVQKVRQADWVSTTAKWGCGGILLLVVFGFLMSLCSNPSPRTATTSNPRSSNRTHNALVDATEDQRAQSLRTAVTSAGERCDRVTRTFHQGTERQSGTEMWNVACRNGNSFVVSVANDAAGSTRVMSCAVMKAVAKVSCFERTP